MAKTKFNELTIVVAIKKLLVVAEKPLSAFRPPHRYGTADKIRNYIHSLIVQVYKINKTFPESDRMPGFRTFMETLAELKILVEECNTLGLFAKKGSKSGYAITSAIKTVESEICRWRNHTERTARENAAKKKPSKIDIPRGVDMLTRDCSSEES